jgi:hypothetical protein
MAGSALCLAKWVMAASLDNSSTDEFNVDPPAPAVNS